MGEESDHMGRGYSPSVVGAERTFLRMTTDTWSSLFLAVGAFKS